MNITEKYCLKWNEFSLYICDSFKELRDDNNFCDVTLACDDGEQIQANKVVLSSCSPVFKSLLRSHPHPHPLLVMRGYTSQYLKQLIDFMYFGEVDVAQQDFNEFLKGAKDLEVQGLSEESTSQQKQKANKQVKKEKNKTQSNHQATVKEEEPSSPKSPKILEVVKTKVSINPMMLDDVPAKTIVLPPEFNVTITPVKDTHEEQDNTPVQVKKQEEEEEEEDPSECYFVSDSEDTEMATENTEEIYQAVPENRMVVDSRPVVETVQAVLKKVSVETPYQATAVPISFAPVQTYTQVPQQVEIYLPASAAPTSTFAPTDPLTIRTRNPSVSQQVFTQVQSPGPTFKQVVAAPALATTQVFSQIKTYGQKAGTSVRSPMPVPVAAVSTPRQTRTRTVVESIQREKEDDPIMKMFSMRSAGGWTCTSCGQFSNQKTVMKIHIQTNHMSGFGHACDQCGKSFRTRGRLLSHIDQAHAS